MNRSRKAALIAAAVVALGLGGVGVAHSQVTPTPKPTTKPKATAKPVKTPKPAATVKPATAAKPVVTQPHHTG